METATTVAWIVLAIAFALLIGFSPVGCTFQVTGSGAGAGASAATQGTSGTQGQIVSEEYNPETGNVIKRTLISGGVEQSQKAAAEAEGTAAAKSSARMISILVPIAIIAALVLILMFGGEVVKFIARIKAGTGL